VLKIKGALFVGTSGLMLWAGSAVAQQNDAVITKQYEEGGVYEGTFKDGKQHGTGTYRLPNGYEYTGQWDICDEWWIRRKKGESHMKTWM